MANDNVELMRGEPEIAVRKLAIPIMFSMILTASYNIVDGIWVAGLGQAAIAGIGFVTPIFMILNGFSVGLGSGATSSISRAIGAKNHDRANKAASHSLLIFLVASIVLTLILMIIQEPLLKGYGAGGQSLVEGIKYGTPLFLGLFAFMFANGASGILRGEGDMTRAMYAIIVSVILNFILDPLFIYVLNLGSTGASLATIVSSLGSACVIMYWILIKKDTYVHVTFKGFKFDSEIAVDILKVGIPQPDHTAPNSFLQTMSSPRQAMKAIRMFKDEYLLDFINVEDIDAQEKDVDERLVEQRIVHNIKRFIMTLGRDFTFVGNQYHLEIYGEEMWSDLLFFNRELNALVAIELKIGKVKPIYLGQLYAYLQVLDDKVRKPHENPSIGIVLCKSANSLSPLHFWLYTENPNLIVMT